MKQNQGRPLAVWSLAGLLGVGALFATPIQAIAGPASTIYSPIIDYREWELELKGGMFNWGQGEDGERAVKLAVAYGVAPRWRVEFEAEYSQTPGSAARVEEYEFENVFQLTEHGEHWMDAGIFAEFEYNRLDNVSSLVVGPMLQKETEHTQTNLNIYWSRRLSALPDAAGSDDGADRRDGLEYQVQWKYNLAPRFQPGVQAFGSLGDPAHLRSEALSVGPAFFGATRLGNARKLRYNAAILAGLTHGTPDTTIRFQLEYEFF